MKAETVAKPYKDTVAFGIIHTNETAVIQNCIYQTFLTKIEDGCYILKQETSLKAICPEDT